MAQRGTRAVEIVLSGQERVELVRWETDETRLRLAERARIVLACAEGASNSAVAAGLGLATMTVAKWRKRFAEAGLDGLADATRPGGRRTSLICPAFFGPREFG